MKIISKATLLFDRENPDTKQKETHRVVPNTLPVDAPDWIRDTDLFELATSDDTIIEVKTAADYAKEAPTPAQLQLVSDKDLVAEVVRRNGGSSSSKYDDWTRTGNGTQYPGDMTDADFASEAAKRGYVLKGAGDGPKLVDKDKQGVNGEAAAALAADGKQDNEDDAAKAAAASAAAKPGAPAPTGGSTQTSVPAAKSGDAKTSRT